MSPDMIDAIVNRKTRNAEIAALKREVERLNGLVSFMQTGAEMAERQAETVRKIASERQAEVERLREAIHNLRGIPDGARLCEVSLDAYCEAQRAAGPLAHKGPGDES